METEFIQIITHYPHVFGSPNGIISITYLPLKEVIPSLLTTLEQCNGKEWKTTNLSINCLCKGQSTCSQCYRFKMPIYPTQEQKIIRENYENYKKIAISTLFSNNSIPGKIARVFIYY